MLSIDEIIRNVSEYNKDADFNLIRKAYNFAKIKHEGQIRASGEPYIIHPISVAEILVSFKMDTESICTGLLHDVVEDTKTSLHEIRSEFGDTIAELIDGVTKIGKIKFSSKSHKQAENFRKFVLAIAKDIRVLIIKLADRLHNMRTLKFLTPEAKRKRIANETIEIYVPLAERIGMQSVVEELQDLVFKELNKSERNEIIKKVKHIYVREEQLISGILKQLKELFEKYNMYDIEITGRAKTPYSIWCKMHKRNVSFDQITDLVGFRVIVNTIAECYRIVFIIHTHFSVLPYKFKDYISTPKQNNYQSIHTSVLGPFNQKIEIQIRTKEMHEISEHGIAAHWNYKLNSNSKSSSDKNEPLRYRWIRGFLQIVEDNQNPDELIHDTKLEMFKNEVFCFTPQGELISLPKNATVVDMAYAIHSYIGNTCVKAKINGIMMPLNTKLNNGDKVEIITSSTQVPQKEWYNFAVTGKAKAAIKKFINMNEKSEFIALGYAIFVQMLFDKKISINNTAFISELVAVFTADKNKDEFYKSIGDGTINQKVLKNMIDSMAKTLLPDTKMIENTNNAITSPSINVDNKKIVFARCCMPISGDDIVSVQLKGFGIAIHRENCKKVQKLKRSHPGAVVKVNWSNYKNKVFATKLKIVMLNQPGSLAQVASVIASHGLNVVNVAIKDNFVDFVVIQVEINVDGIESFQNLCASLRTNVRVKSVERI